MAQIHNTDLFKEIRDGIKLQQLTDVIPSQLADKVVPVMEVNPHLLRKTSILVYLNRVATSTSLTLYTSPTNKETYITGLWISNIQDNICDNVIMQVLMTTEGVARQVYIRRKPTTTASVTVDYLKFDIPLKLDKNSLVTYTVAFTAGTSNTDFILYGYTVDNPNA